jgi:3',5'-cyclic AMP phosphodiesterase CpdA
VHDSSAGRCLFLDTVEPGTHAGRYCATRQSWLEQRLAEHDGPFLLFMHHNPMPTHLGPMDQIRLLDDLAFRGIVGRHRDKIRHIFFGHCHLPLAGSVAGVPVSSLRGTNHASYPLFAETAMLSASDLPESYGVAFFGPDYVTVHMVEFGYTGAIRVEGSPDYKSWNRETMLR